MVVQSEDSAGGRFLPGPWRSAWGESGFAPAVWETPLRMSDGAPLITGVDFVCIPARDFEAMTAFYGETLGLPFVKRYGNRAGAEYQAGNLTLAIMRTEDFGGTFSANAMPIALQVSDVATARAALEAKGVRFVSETFDSGVCWQAICVDPDGNPLSLHHRYAPTDEHPAAL